MPRACLLHLLSMFDLKLQLICSHFGTILVIVVCGEGYSDVLYYILLFPMSSQVATRH